MPPTLTTEDLLARLDAAFKAVTDTTSLGDSILSTQKFDRFVREARDATVALPDARFLRMDSPRVEIDRVGFTGRILTPGRDATDAHIDLTEAQFVEPVTATNFLLAQELIAITSLRDHALRRNIERGGFENTLVDLFGQAAGRDLEEYAFLADTAFAGFAGTILAKTDGWIARAANKVYGVESSPGAGDQDFDPSDPESIFQACLDALPKRFITNREDWRLYVPFEVYDAYQDILRNRGTDLGDTSQTTGAQRRPLLWKGFPVVYVPGLERSVPNPNGKGRIVTLQNPDNMVWGVFHEVTIEREREAKARRTDFVLTVEADADYEDENAAVAAFLDLPKVP